MFGKLILIVAIIGLVWIASSLIRRNQISQKKKPAQSKDMVQCVQCQTYLPKDEAVEQDNHFFLRTATS